MWIIDLINPKEILLVDWCNKEWCFSLLFNNHFRIIVHEIVQSILCFCGLGCHKYIHDSEPRVTHVVGQEEWSPGVEVEPPCEIENTRHFFTLRQCFLGKPDRMIQMNCWTELNCFLGFLEFHNRQYIEVVLAAEVDETNIVHELCSLVLLKQQ